MSRRVAFAFANYFGIERPPHDHTFCLELGSAITATETRDVADFPESEQESRKPPFLN